MALFRMAENFLSPVKLEIECPRSFYARQGSIEGHIRLTSQGAYQIDEVVMVMIERSQVSGEREEEAVVGKASVCSRPFTIDANEVKILEFSLSFRLAEYGWDSVINEGGVLGLLGKVVDHFDDGNDDVSRSYDLVAAAEVRGSKFDPKVVKGIIRSE